MTKVRVAINGFGRIGRLTARHLLTRYKEEVEIVAVNDLTNPENLGYLFKHDSTYRKFEYPVTVENGNILVNRNGENLEIKVLSERDPVNLPWKEMNIDMVIESTGFFLTRELAEKHLQAGAKKVVLSAPAKDKTIPTLVLGVNNELLRETDSKVISNASCTTNCMAPALKVLNDNLDIKDLFGITAHAYTATQVLQDGPSKKAQRDGRAAAVNAIPASTGAAKAVELVIPELKGKMSLSALRIPVITGSMVYLTINLNQSTTPEAVNKLFKEAAEGSLEGVLGYTEEDIVSSDIVQDPHSSIIDAQLTEVLGNTLKVVTWYDNEWGYSNRLAEVVTKW
jgi:glyceraldehyde 3-phosphate dehydrogenase